MWHHWSDMFGLAYVVGYPSIKQALGYQKPLCWLISMTVISHKSYYLAYMGQVTKGGPVLLPDFAIIW